MSKLALAFTLAFLASRPSPGAAAAEPACPAQAHFFDGQWIADLSTQADPAHADVYSVASGMYRCESCDPPRAYPADGEVRVIPGAPGTRESVTVTGPRTIVTRIETADQVRSTTMTVAADDRTATYVSLDERRDVPGPLRTIYLARRVASAPAGAHPVSGSWLAVGYVEVPEAYRSVEFREAGGLITRITPTHGRYTARIDGTPAPLEGLAGSTLKVSVRKPECRTLVERFSSDSGKLVFERAYKLATDGRTLETATTNGSGEVFRVTSHRK